MDTVLIVDDDPLQVAIIEEILGEGNFRLFKAGDGVEAKNVLSQPVEDLKVVVLDWMMPRMDGIALLRWMKSQAHLENVEVIMQSGRIASEDVQQGLSAGACFYLTKPFEPHQLEALVRAAVSNANLKHVLHERIRKAQGVFRLIQEGVFQFKSLVDAEALAASLAAGCGYGNSGIGLFEILANAVEHGNLGITYEEKGQLLEEGRFDQEVRARLLLPEHRRKKVTVEIRRRDEDLTVLVSDMGQGFDFRRYLEFDKTRMFDSHGRGILMARSLLRLEYLEPGNKVEITVPIHEVAAEA